MLKYVYSMQLFMELGYRGTISGEQTLEKMDLLIDFWL